MRVAITGASGYLGTKIRSYLEDHGHTGVLLSHSSRSTTEKQIPFDLQNGIDRESLRGIDALIHCAYDFSVLRWKGILEVNVEGSRRLFQAAKSAGISTIVLISTMSAFPSCRSLYGRAKLLIEAEAEKIGAIVIRPGLVYDSQAGGMVGALRAAVEKFSLIPLIGRGDQKLYLLHSEDLCRFVYLILEGRISKTTGPVTLAHEQGFTFRDILKIIALASGKSPFFFPLPSACVSSALRIAEFSGIHWRIRSDGVESLLYSDLAPSFSEMRRTGFEPRPFSLKTLNG